MTVFYKKVNGEYVEISEYDAEFNDAIPLNTAMLTVSKGSSTTRRYNVDIAIAPLLAGSIHLEDTVCNLLSKALQARPATIQDMTPKEQEAWDNLMTIGGDNFNMLTHESIGEVSRGISDKLMEKMASVLDDPSCKDAYDMFVSMVKLKLGSNIV